MQIDRLTLHNFRLFREAQFEFAPGLNLVLGDNGGGKTSVIEGLAVALGGWLLGIRGHDARPIRSEDLRVEPSPLPNGRIDFIDVPPTVVAAWGTVLDEPIHWARSKFSKGGKTRYGDAHEIKTLSEEAALRVSKRDTFTLPIIANYGSGRLFRDVRGRERLRAPRVGERQRPGRLSAYKLSVDSRIDKSAFLQYFADEAWSAFQRGTESAEFRAVKDALMSCMDGAHAIDFNPYTSEVVADMRDTGLVPFSYLSDGQRTVLAMVGDLCLKIMTLNRHLGSRAFAETPGVVLIDEIDLHLHPNWQRRICGDLTRTFPKLQFIATTHSPQVIGSIPKDRVVRLGEVDRWDRPWLGTKGAETNEILNYVMGGTDQALRADELGKAVEAALDAEDLPQAEEHYAAYLKETEEPTNQRTYLETLMENARLFAGEEGERVARERG